MQKTKVIPLGDNCSVTVKELRVKEVRQLLGKFNDFATIDVRDLFGTRFAEVSALVSPLLEFPEGISIDDLTGSEIETVIAGVVEVNQSFLALAGLDQIAAAMLSNSSTLPAASSSSADTPGSPTTDGVSSSSPLAMPTDEGGQKADSGDNRQSDQQT